MKRSSLLKHLSKHGCYLKREGRSPNAIYFEKRLGRFVAVGRKPRKPNAFLTNRVVFVSEAAQVGC
jgi:hypothetical protein